MIVMTAIGIHSQGMVIILSRKDNMIIDRMADITATGPTEIMVGVVVMAEALVGLDIRDGAADMAATDVDIFGEAFN